MGGVISNNLTAVAARLQDNKKKIPQAESKTTEET